eukprot:TRINITY_DN7859_c0_g1_i4.p1 TRINITY_DN7859_c0_g1~~TRINITY_DN7859_c0_g1_i4.p1  ORF type:complete len:886 (-),score=168.97 TRINITY_DN7859_c0_g1_i4:206-2863(-)
MTDSKYFTTTKRGEIAELKRELDSPKEKEKTDAVKKVIALMTVGKDVSPLFPDVVKCIRTTNLELKKLVYLYIMNYAKTQPETAILSVNAFVTDAQHPNPLVRALAVRTMGCIRVDKITEYLCQPLRECLKDADPYVRKTAAVCVAKMWDINSELVENQGFLDTLRDLLSDSNPMVVANAVAALSEIDETTNVFTINTSTLNKLLAALNECTEWGQVFILHAIARCTPRDQRDAESIAERVAPRLAHSNSAVVLNTIRVLMHLLDFVDNGEFADSLCKKMTPPLVTLLQKQPEIQYVALRNINLVIQKRPTVLQSEMKVFFCKYNDPIYVKMEKLEVMIMLVSERTIEQVLMELKEYATEVDVEFVRKAVRAIGRCAIKLDRAAEKCVNALLELIKTKVNYVVQEAIIVIKDIFRKYPNRYESIIATLCENLDTLDEPEAKASMIWIVGEYAERIENADELLESFLDNFIEENAMVQLQLLTATVKLFLKKPKTTQKLVQYALDLATKESGNPDLRDRGFIYWRLLSADPDAARQVVLSEKPLISESSSALDPSVLDSLIVHMATLASVYHKPPEAFVSKLKKKVRVLDGSAEAARDKKRRSRRGDNDADGDTNTNSSSATDVTPPTSGGMPNLGGLSLIEMDSPAGPTPASPGVGSNSNDPFGFLAALGGGPASSGPQQPELPILLPADRGSGLELRGTFANKGGQIVFSVVLTNHTSAPMNGFMISFNKNPYRLKPVSPVIQIAQLNPGQSQSSDVGLSADGEPAAAPSIQIALKNNVSVFYFTADCHVHTFFAPGVQVPRQQYLSVWADWEQTEMSSQVATSLSVPAIIATLQQHNMQLVAQRSVGQVYTTHNTHHTPHHTQITHTSHVCVCCRRYCIWQQK